MSTELAVNTTPGELDRIVKYWWPRWIGMHWGFRTHTACFWCTTGEVSQFEALHVLGIETIHPLDVVIFMRELVTTQAHEYDLAKQIVSMTPEEERPHTRRFYAGKQCFERGDGITRTIAQLIDEVTLPAKLPKLRPTDDSAATRIPTARMVSDAVRRNYTMRGDDPPQEKAKGPILFITEDCPKLLSAIPSLIADRKNPEEVEDNGTEQDCVWSGCMNSFREYISVRREAPLEVRRRQAIDLAPDPSGKYMNLIRFDAKMQTQKRRQRRR